MGKFLYPLPDEYYNDSDGYNYHGGHSYYDSTRSQPQHGLGKLDFTCPEGTEVRSMTPGTVVRAGSDSNGEYTSVQVQVSGNNYWPTSENENESLIIRYYHIQPSVSEGDTVAQGDVLGTVGDPDVTSSQHLHLDFASDTSPTLLKGRLTYNQLTDEQKTCLSTWYGQNTGGSSFESTFSNNADVAGGSSNSQNNGVGCWGRCWEVIATEATYETATSSSEGNANLPAGYMGSSAYDLSSKVGGFTDQDKHRVAYLCGREMGNGNYFESDSTKSTAGRCLYAFLIRAHFFERYTENLTGTEILDKVFANGGFSGYTGSSATYSYDDIDEIWNSFVAADTSNLTTQALSIAQYGPCCNYGWGAWYTATEASQEAITEACEAGNAPSSNATWHLSLQFCGAYGNTSFHGPLNSSGFESNL